MEKLNEVLVLNAREISSLITLPMAIQAVERAYVDKSSGRGGLWPMVFHDFEPGKADLDIKSGDLPGLGCYGLKVVSWFGDNPGKGLPALFGTSLLFDVGSGAPRALLNAGPITEYRTGAAGALGAKHLARPGSDTMLMCGTGGLAPYLVAATLYLMPELERVYISNPHHPEKAARLCPQICRRVDELLAASGASRRAELIPAPDLGEAAGRSQIVLTATPARHAYLEDRWIRPGTHISCVGADMAGKQEIQSQIFSRARVFGDDEAQCLTVGECELPYKQGLLSGLDGELGAVIAGEIPGRTGGDQITIFDSTGIALQDIAAASALVEAAEHAGLGTKVLL